ncbi:K+-transporting ATPase ATPase A chain [Clostridium cavendishii DSM 21758]|uniref:Potassium-transporting ATPase potassium-binding subunit n=1 Tax=Clostridium cavendishii DSM 21758 TaxID=1121302 RepID=A0A1M6QT66_9CLOT|nr:potassium-transporting ATPase subunit KdpA [Clostridium cavendishii]SHK23298.1 K+-transporting ATPase ATPase A chain [Clostridium cavendishii DSM 21758]
MKYGDFILLMVLFILCVIPLGSHLHKVITKEDGLFDAFFNKVDNFIYKISGIDKDEEMPLKGYIKALLITNLVMFLFVFIILKAQGILSVFNPNDVSAMETSQAFNTASSFITNTNWQSYAGENTLSYLSQMTCIIFLMFTSAATGCSVAAAIIRTVAGKKKSLGNFYVDVVRFTTRVFLPLAFIVSILLIACGVPQNLQANQIVKTIEGTYQTIAMGPVAALESIKHLGTNGGGFFNANSSHPFENPNGITNIIEMLSMMVIPGGLIISFGLTLKNKKQGWVFFISAAILFLVSLTVVYFAESKGNPILSSLGLDNKLGNLEGKETRFGVLGSSLFTTVTTSFTTGSVNNMHDSLTPLAGFGAMWGMMLNVVFGGDGVGFMGLIMYAILTVFICGLMVGRTPEFLGKKVEGKEIKLIAFTILVHPILILMPSAVSLVSGVGKDSISNSGFHGLSQILYAFTSTAANNGSAFGGLNANTAYYNSFTGVIMLLGRYLSIMLLLAVASSLASKRTVPETVGTFRTDNAMFVMMLVFIVLVVGALTFLPALALGPISEYLTFI